MRHTNSGAALIIASALHLVNGARLPIRADFASCLSSNSVAVLTSSSNGWNEAITPYNLRFQGQITPAAMIYPSSTSEISAALSCASGSGMHVSALSGGHSYSASGYGTPSNNSNTLVVNLSKMNTLSVDSSSGRAQVQTGLRLGDVAQGLYDNGGLALAHGTCPYVGVGGHTSYGGYGFGSRKWGLMLDQVVEAEIVLANGTVVNASENENKDLFWALRGAAPSFGIVTQWTFQTHAAPSALVGFNYAYSVPDAATFSRLLTAYTSWTASSAPAELGLEANLGKNSISILGLYEGTEDSFNSIISGLLSGMGSPDNSEVKSYGWIEALEWLAGLSTLSTSGAADTHDTFYAKSLITPLQNPLTADVYTAWGEYLLASSTSTSYFLQIELYGGANSAVNSPSSDSTAYTYRDSQFVIQLYASSSNSQPPYPEDDGKAFLDGMVNTIQGAMQGTEFGAYMNYVDPDLESWQEKYYGENYQRLTELQKIYDPSNLFMKHQSIGSQ